MTAFGSKAEIQTAPLRSLLMLSGQSILMSASLATLRQRSISEATNGAMTVGLAGPGTAPCSAQTDLIWSVPRALAISATSLSVMSLGVPVGANRSEERRVGKECA